MSSLSFPQVTNFRERVLSSSLEMLGTTCIAGEGNGNPLQYSCLENPMDRGAWWATIHRISKSQTLLGNYTFTQTCISEFRNVQILNRYYDVYIYIAILYII